jgi:ppGpp synthetase/RelA/SpoT-type nucleotidyltranferase
LYLFIHFLFRNQGGDRLRTGTIDEPDLKILDDYRKSFGRAYEEVVRLIREKINVDLTGRPAKSTSSIVEKLHRESIRLSQVQDIAGCRIVVKDMREQERVVALLRDIFPVLSVVDRRARPSYGYRAVHVIIQVQGKLIEVQVRTELQHSWAELSEKFSDKIDPTIKYGGGDSKVQELFYGFSDSLKDCETAEYSIGSIDGELNNYPVDKKLLRLRKLNAVNKEKINNLKRKIVESIKKLCQ